MLKLDLDSNQRLLVDTNKTDESSLLTDTDIKYQDIEYSMHNRYNCVYYNEHKQVDLQLALAELTSLDWTVSQNGISFINNKNGQSIFCHRLTEDKWLALTPIKVNGVWNQYEWASNPDTESLIAVIKLYFEEIPWFESLTWKEVKWSSDFGC